MAEDVKNARKGNNGLDPEKANSYVGRIENLHKDLDTLRGKYMSECKVVREDIKVVLDEAKDDGFPKKSLKAVVKTRELERKAKACREDLADIDDMDKFDLIRDALGDFADTDLGRAATGQNGATAQA